MIRLLVIVFALIVAIGAGLGGLIHFGILPDFTGMIVPPGQRAASEAVEEAPPAPRVDPIFFDMPPLLVPVIQDGELQRNIFIAFRVEVTPGAEEKARMHMSQLHDVYLRALYDIVPKQLKKRKTLDLRRLKARLMEISDRVTGPGVIADLVVLSVFER